MSKLNFLSSFEEGTDNDFPNDNTTPTINTNPEYEIDKALPDVAIVGLTVNPEEINKLDKVSLYKVGSNKNGGSVFCCNINSAVGGLSDYFILLEHICNMNVNDVLVIKIASPGGSITTATQICSFMEDCKGTIITHACGLCASAGSLIWSCGHMCTIGNSALFMWHMSSHADCGNTVAIEQNANSLRNYVRDVLLKNSLEKGFIKQEEITNIYTKANFTCWITAQEMRKRLDEYNKTINKPTVPTDGIATDDDQELDKILSKEEGDE